MNAHRAAHDGIACNQYRGQSAGSAGALVPDVYLGSAADDAPLPLPPHIGDGRERKKSEGER